MNRLSSLLFIVPLLVSPLSAEPTKGVQASRQGNPIADGWYADPEGTIYGNQYWVFPTYSAPYDQQTHFDAFSSPDLVKWTKHDNVLTTDKISWAKRALWAPSILEKDRQYFFFFAANDIQNDQQVGGIGVAVASKPEGPYKDYLGKPLVDKIIHKAQPIDPYVFHDDDGSYYLIYGGWGHCNIAKMTPDFKGFIPFPDGETYKPITPEGYVEGPFVFKRNGKYYFMWSEGGWTGPDYKVAYAISDSLLGPHKRIGTVLAQDPSIATGAGHHSIIHNPKNDSWYIVYHRRPLGETDGNHRVTCIDKMEFDAEGKIKPVTMTREGVSPNPLGFRSSR